MKRLFLAFTLCLGLVFTAGAQVISTNTDVTAEDYENYLEGKMKVEFREKVIKSMDLTEDQIIAFDPIFRDYMDDKKMLVEEKYKLVKDYEDEMAEDDTAKDEDEETAGFIENFWEVEIKEMELQKDFFDRFEEVVSTDKAINFFLLEDDMVNQMMRPAMIHVVPMIVEYGPIFEYSEEEKMKMKEEMKDSSSINKNSSSYMTKEKDQDSWSSDAPKATESAWSETKQEVNATTEEVEETAETAWNETKQEVNAATEEVEETAETAWNETKQEVNEATEEVEETAESAWNETEETASEAEAATETTWNDEEMTEKSATTAMNNDEDKVKAFSSWVQNSNKEVSLSHQYTHDGLNHLVSAIWTVAEANDIDVSEWESKKTQILDIADQIQVDMYSTDHADHSRKAFIMIADMIDAIQNKAYTSEEAEKISSEVATAARAIDPDVLMTPQAEKVYTFFEHADKAVSTMSAPATAGQSTNSPTYNNDK